MRLNGQTSIRMAKTQRALMAWLAVVALFVQAFAPLSAAWAFDAQATGDVQVICTANGVQTISLGKDGGPVEQQDGFSCPLCVLHASAISVWDANDDVIQPEVLEAQAFVLPGDFSHASVWRALPRPPRGPPVTV